MSDPYCILSSGYDRLAEKHDSLRHTVYKLVAQLDIHTEALTALNEWKIRTQKSFAEVKVQDQDPKLLYYGTPHSASTVDIATEQVEPDPVEAANPTSKTMIDRRDSGVADLETPLKRIRKTADKRKAAASHVKPIDKRAKKSHK